MEDLTPDQIAALEAAGLDPANYKPAAPPAEKEGDEKDPEDGDKPDEKDPVKLAEYWKSKAQKNANEAKNLRTRNKDLEQFKTEAERSKMTDDEKKEADRQAAITRAATVEQELLNTKIQVAAMKLGFADPDDAVALIDKSAIKEDRSNIEGLLKKVLDGKPYLKGAASSRTPLPKGLGEYQPANGGQGAEDKAKRDSVVGSFGQVFSRLKFRD